MEDDFFDNNTNNEVHIANDDGVHIQQELEHQEGHQQQDSHFDDYFAQSDQTQQQQQQHQQQPEEIDDFFGAPQSNTVQSSYVTYGEQSTAYDQGANNNYGGFEAVESVSQQSEQDQRRSRLQKEDQERTQLLIAKQNEEYAVKSTKLSNAKQYLSNWKLERDQATVKRKQVCLQEEEVAIEARQKVTYRNSWEKVTENISLKSSEHPGEKDVTRMRESILAKKSDLLNAKN